VIWACFHARDARARRTKIIQSVFVNAGLLTCRRRIMSCCRRKAFSATSSDLLRLRSVSVPNMSEVVSGFVQSTKSWWSDWRQRPVNRVMKVRIPSIVYVTPSEDEQVNAFQFYSPRREISKMRESWEGVLKGLNWRTDLASSQHTRERPPSNCAMEGISTDQRQNGPIDSSTAISSRSRKWLLSHA
jgi:hypothetical protein